MDKYKLFLKGWYASDVTSTSTTVLYLKLSLIYPKSLTRNLHWKLYQRKQKETEITEVLIACFKTQPITHTAGRNGHAVSVQTTGQFMCI